MSCAKSWCRAFEPQASAGGAELLLLVLTRALRRSMIDQHRERERERERGETRTRGWALCIQTPSQAITHSPRRRGSRACSTRSSNPKLARSMLACFVFDVCVCVDWQQRANANARHRPRASQLAPRHAGRRCLCAGRRKTSALAVVGNLCHVSYGASEHRAGSSKRERTPSRLPLSSSKQPRSKRRGNQLPARQPTLFSPRSSSSSTFLQTATCAPRCAQRWIDRCAILSRAAGMSPAALARCCRRSRAGFGPRAMLLHGGSGHAQSTRPRRGHCERRSASERDSRLEQNRSQR